MSTTHRGSSLDEEFARFAEEPFAEPDDLYDRLRATDPVYRAPMGYWFVTRYDLAERILQDDVVWSSNPTAAAGSDRPEWARLDGPASRIFRQCLVFLDGADHRRLRGLVRGVFAPRAVAAFGARIRSTVARLLDAATCHGGTGDFLADYAVSLP